MNTYSRAEIAQLYNTPVLELIQKASLVHQQWHKKNTIKVCSLLSVKTGACTEDCSYCAQSAKYQKKVGLKTEKLLPIGQVIDAAQKAKAQGSSRFCIGAAWREVKDNKDFDNVVEMVREVDKLGMQVCTSLGMITEEQAIRLKENGLHAYNHNIDTSKDFYKTIISTRTHEDRIKTLNILGENNISVCTGGIVGMGESSKDRIDMIETLSSLTPSPESVPVNAFVPIAGTPLEDAQQYDVWDMVRVIATTRIVIPKTYIRLAAGRAQMTDEAQALCFMAGANSIFAGENLLTTPNVKGNKDDVLFEKLGLIKEG